MNVIEQNLVRGPNQTGKLMHWLAKTYRDDLIEYLHLDPSEFYGLVKAIPYGYDPNEVEMVSRPKYTLERRTPWADCDDKAVVIAAYALKKGIPYRFRAIGIKHPQQKWYEKTRLQHVYPELYLNNRWIPFDATYEYNTLGREMGPYDRYEFI